MSEYKACIVQIEHGKHLMQKFTAEHHAEVGIAGKELDIDWERIKEMEKVGAHVGIGVFQDRQIVGYIGIVVAHHLHHKTEVHADTHAVYVHPDHRNQGALDELINTAEKTLKRADINRFNISFNTYNLETPLACRGYDKVDSVFGKDIC